ncbi:type I restriction-modification system subunit M N-terminal domain-containing protein [Nostoc sp.]|uniref:type I restriction-modification system subunit M N-terminal domain-containing protein n=1 Tax=Nostoc sp. TaxID=1180 RepID=UPI002FF568D2
MNHTTHNTIVNFIWNIADDVLRDVYVRGKYRDVILPMTVLRRLDCLLEPTKEKVLEHYKLLEKDNFGQNAVAQQLPRTSGYVFYNTSQFTFKTLLNFPSQIRANFENYLDGFSENAQEIIDKFKLRNQIETLTESNRLYALIDKFVSNHINLSSEPVKNAEGEITLQGLTNLEMGYVFEELIRKFNEENNEEAGEHFKQSKIFDNEDFGYHKITVDRPLRLTFQVTSERVAQFLGASLTNSSTNKSSRGQQEIPLHLTSDTKHGVILGILKDLFSSDPHKDFNRVKQEFEKVLKAEEIKLTAKDLKLVYDTFTEKDETAEPVINKKTKDAVVYEPDSELRDTENVPLKEDIEEYFAREVLPHVPEFGVQLNPPVPIFVRLATDNISPHFLNNADRCLA